MVSDRRALRDGDPDVLAVALREAEEETGFDIRKGYISSDFRY